MSALLKLLPMAALGYVAYDNSGVLMKALDVVGKVQVEATSGIEMQGIAKVVTLEYMDNGTLPVEDFSGFLIKNMRQEDGRSTRDKSRDMWGTKYKLAQAGEGFEVSSAGPDKAWSTPDDLKLYQSLKGLGDGFATAPGSSAPAVPTIPAGADTTSTLAPQSPPLPASPVDSEPYKPAPYQWKRG